MYAHTLAQNEATFLTAVISPMSDKDRATQIALLIKNLAGLAPNHIEGMLIAFIGLNLSEEQRAQAINTTFDRIDGVDNMWLFDGTLEAARRLSLGSDSVSDVFQQRAAAYAEGTTSDRARTVQCVLEGKAHSARWYPKAA